MTAAGQRNLEPNTVFSKAPSIYMPRTTTPLEVEKKKKKYFNVEERIQAVGAVGAMGILKKIRRTHKRVKKNQTHSALLTPFVLKDKMEKTVFWESVQRS